MCFFFVLDMFDCTCLRLSRLSRLARAEAATDFDGFCTCPTGSKHAVVHDEGSNCRRSDTFSLEPIC